MGNKKKPTKSVTKIDGNSNDSKELTDSAILECVEALTSDEPNNRERKFWYLRLYDVPAPSAAKIAGYKQNTGYKLVEKYRNKAIYRQKVEEFFDGFDDKYRLACKSMLARITGVEMKALQQYESDPALAIKKPQLLKHLKQAAGIDMNEAPSPKPQSVRIRNVTLIQNISKRLLEDKELAIDSVDAEFQEQKKD